MLTDDGYRQIMQHARRLAQGGRGELAQHLRDAIDLRAEVEALNLERAAAEIVHRETATTVLMQMAEVQRLRDAPQQAEPAAQIGWADEFGNLFPMGAWKPAQRTHHDSHKAAWRPVFLHPPADEVRRLRDAVAKLSTIVRVPNAEHIADEHNAAVAFLRRALEGGE